MARDINAQDVNGRTALHNAVINKQPQEVINLLQLGADPNAKDKKGRNGLTPMWYACCQNADPLSFMALKAAGATIDQNMLDEIKRQAKADPINRDKKAIRTSLGIK